MNFKIFAAVLLLAIFAMRSIAAPPEQREATVSDLLKLLDEQAQQLPDPAARADIAIAQVEALLECGANSKAIEASKRATALLQQLEDAPQLGEFISRLTPLLVQLEHSDQALELAKLIPQPQRQFILEQILNAAVPARQWKTAATAIEQMEFLPAKADGLSRLALAQHQATTHDQALETFRKAIGTAQAIDDAFLKAEVLASIAESLTRCRCYDRSMELVRSVAETLDVSLVLQSIAQIQRENGDIAASLATARQIEDLEARIVALRGVAAQQAAEGQFPAAWEWIQQESDARLRCQCLLGALAGLKEPTKTATAQVSSPQVRR